jgi:hypothetical protein
MLGEWFFGPTRFKVAPSRLMELWIRIIKQPLIPYDMEERRKQLKHAFDELRPYVEIYENTTTET